MGHFSGSYRDFGGISGSSWNTFGIFSWLDVKNSNGCCVE